MMAGETIPPRTMRRLVVTSPGNGGSVSDCIVEIQTLPTPVPSPGELLIRVCAAPVNPSDYGGWYKKSSNDDASMYPLPMGIEGCGIVVSSGGMLGDGFGAMLGGMSSYFRFPVGAHVGFVISESGGGSARRERQGSYSEYVVVNASTGCFPMPSDVPIEDCASFFVNPYTALGIIDVARNAGSGNAIVHTAGASQLGMMLNRLAHIEGMEVINVVRRVEQKEMLESIVGARHVIVTDDGLEGGGCDPYAWKAELRAMAKDMGATCAFDAVSGDMTGHLLDCMPRKGIVYSYGVLGGKANGIDMLDLIYRRKEIRGFMLTSWLHGGGPLRMIPRVLAANARVNEGLREGGWCRTQFVDVTMENAHAEIVRLLGSSITGKKLRIRFDGD